MSSRRGRPHREAVERLERLARLKPPSDNGREPCRRTSIIFKSPSPGVFSMRSSHRRASRGGTAWRRRVSQTLGEHWFDQKRSLILGAPSRRPGLQELYDQRDPRAGFGSSRRACISRCSGIDASSGPRTDPRPETKPPAPAALSIADPQKDFKQDIKNYGYRTLAAHRESCFPASVFGPVFSLIREKHFLLSRSTDTRAFFPTPPKSNSFIHQRG